MLWWKKETNRPYEWEGELDPEELNPNFIHTNPDLILASFIVNSDLILTLFIVSHDLIHLKSILT